MKISIALIVGCIGIVATSAHLLAQLWVAPASQNFRSPAPAVRFPVPERLTPTRENQRIDDLMKEIANLKVSLSALHKRLDHNASPVSIAPVREAPRVTHYEPGLQQVLEDEIEQARSAFVEQLEMAFQAEITDPSWSTSAFDLLMETLDVDDFAGTVVHSLSCRSHQCRMEVEHFDTQAQAAFETHLPPLVGPSLPEIAMGETLETENGLLTVVFLSRRSS